jgi:hypothetical protein
MTIAEGQRKWWILAAMIGRARRDPLVGGALFGTLRTVTGHYASLFFLTGALLLAMAIAAGQRSSTRGRNERPPRK